LILTASAVI